MTTLINAKIYSLGEKDIIENGFISFKGGKIKAIGSMQGFVPSGENIEDCKNCVIIPGLIDSHCHIGLWEDSLGFEGDDGNEDTDPVTPHLRVIDAINPFDKCFSEALMSGVTTVVVSPGSANPIAGQVSALSTFGKSIEDKIIKSNIAIKVALGENPKTTYHSKNLAPVTRMATAAIIREQLFKAQRYEQDIDKANKSEDYDLPDFCIKCEALLPVIKKEIPLHIHAHRADDILTAIRISKEFNIKIKIVHGTDSALVLDELKDNNVEVMFGPALCDRSKPELKNLSYKTIFELNCKKVLSSIITDHPVVPINYLLLSAALTVREGLTEVEALKLITVNAAKICGIDSTKGSLKIDKDADIVILEGNPLDINTKVKSVIIKGNKVL